MGNHNDDPARCQTGDEFIRWCARHGGAIVNGGRHPKVYFGNQMRPVPHGTLAKGTKHALLKWLIVVGVAIWLVTLIF